VFRVETREEKKERRKREKAEQVAYKLEQVQLFFLADFYESAGESCYSCYYLLPSLPIHIRILPQVLHILENREKKIYFYSPLRYFTAFSFLLEGACVMIFSIVTNFHEKI
jgi:hypothetical protein